MNVRNYDRESEMDRPAGNSKTLALAVCSAAIGGTFQYGYNLSIMNAPTNHIQRFINDTYWERWGVGLDTSQVTLLWTVIVSAYSLGGLAGALLAGPMAVRFGRKKSLLLNNVFLFVGAVFTLTSRMARSVEMIILARLLVGVNAGVSMNIQPMYFAESAPKHMRGAVAFSSAVFTAFGIFMGQVVGLTELLGTEPLWPYLLASNTLPGVLQLLTLPWFPESPRYLLMDLGDKEACAQALTRLRGKGTISLEIEEMLQEQVDAGGPAAKSQSPWDLFSDRSLHPQLCTIMVTSSAMMLCGNDSIYFYASYIFLEAGISIEKVQYVSLGTGACEFTAAIMSNLLIERVGRKMLLSGGYTLMAGWALVFTLALTLQSYSVPGMPYLSMACVFCYILSFGIGPAGVTGILPAEIFDQTARPAAYMVAGSLLWINLFIVGMAFPFIVNYLGVFCFIPFCAVCVLASLFVGFTLPETKGKTLAEITAEFDRRHPVKRQGAEPVKEHYKLGKAFSLTSLDPEPLPLTSLDPEPLPLTSLDPEPLPLTSIDPEPLPLTSLDPEPLPLTSQDPEPLSLTSLDPEPLPLTSLDSEPLPLTSLDPEPLPHTSLDSEPLPLTSLDPEPLPLTSLDPEPLPLTGLDPEPLPLMGLDPEPLPLTGLDPEPLPLTGLDPKPLPFTSLDQVPRWEG